jgi:hypothetical protein
LSPSPIRVGVERARKVMANGASIFACPIHNYIFFSYPVEWKSRLREIKIRE